MSEIVINVDRKGNAVITTSGFTGVSCQDATRFLEALGDKASDAPTAEMFQKEELMEDNIQ